MDPWSHRTHAVSSWAFPISGTTWLFHGSRTASLCPREQGLILRKSWVLVPATLLNSNVILSKLPSLSKLLSWGLHSFDLKYLGAVPCQHTRPNFFHGHTAFHYIALSLFPDGHLGCFQSFALEAVLPCRWVHCTHGVSLCGIYSDKWSCWVERSLYLKAG